MKLDLKLGILWIGIGLAADCDIVSKIWADYGKIPLSDCCLFSGIICDINSNVLKMYNHLNDS